MDNPLHIQPDAQLCLASKKIRLRAGCCLLVWAQPFLPLLEIDIEAPLFVAIDNAGQERLMLTSRAMMGEQRNTDGDMLILVVLSQCVAPILPAPGRLLHGHSPSHWPILELVAGDPHVLKHSEDPH
jgi:hypothetical protein